MTLLDPNRSWEIIDDTNPRSERVRKVLESWGAKAIWQVPKDHPAASISPLIIRFMIRTTDCQPDVNGVKTAGWQYAHYDRSWPGSVYRNTDQSYNAASASQAAYLFILDVERENIEATSKALSRARNRQMELEKLVELEYEKARP